MYTHVTQLTRGSQSQFSPFSMWIMRTELKSPHLAASIFTD